MCRKTTNPRQGITTIWADAVDQDQIRRKTTNPRQGITTTTSWRGTTPTQVGRQPILDRGLQLGVRRHYVRGTVPGRKNNQSSTGDYNLATFAGRIHGRKRRKTTNPRQGITTVRGQNGADTTRPPCRKTTNPRQGITTHPLIGTNGRAENWSEDNQSSTGDYNRNMTTGGCWVSDLGRKTTRSSTGITTCCPGCNRAANMALQFGRQQILDRGLQRGDYAPFSYRVKFDSRKTTRILDRGLQCGIP